MLKIGMVHSTIRGDEKLLMNAARKRTIELIPIDIRKQILNPETGYRTVPCETWQERFDVILERCVSTTLGMHAVSFFEGQNVPVVNTSRVAQLCADKFTTSLKLRNNNVPTIPFAMAFSEDEAAEAAEQLGGYPVVLKPATGSWGRLLAKINDRDALEAVIEQKFVLGTPPHKAFYIQKYIEKPGRDIRVTTIGDKAICAIYREATHWITNTARGAKAKPCKINEALEKLSLAASHAVGGGVLGIDIVETRAGYVENEINHTTEFKNVQRVTEVDVAGKILEYCLEVANGNH